MRKNGLIGISDITNSQMMTDYVRIKEENSKLNQLIDQLLKENSELRQIPKSEGMVKLTVSPEEHILLQQIERLYSVSKLRALDIGEAKMLDLYIKNKRLLEEKSSANIDVSAKEVKQISSEKLMELVGGSESED